MFPSFPDTFPGVFNIVISYMLTANMGEPPTATLQRKYPMLFLMSLHIAKKVLPAYELMAVS